MWLLFKEKRKKRLSRNNRLSFVWCEFISPGPFNNHILKFLFLLLLFFFAWRLRIDFTFYCKWFQAKPLTKLKILGSSLNFPAQWASGLLSPVEETLDVFIDLSETVPEGFPGRAPCLDYEQEKKKIHPLLPCSRVDSGMQMSIRL